MSKTDFKITGMKDLLANLKNIEKTSTQKAVLRKTIDEASQPMLADAKARASSVVGKSPYSRKGANKRMADSFRLSSRLTKEAKRYNKNMGYEDSKTAVTRHLGSNHKAAVMTELGTKPHILGGRFKGAKHPGTEPKPMLRPAFDNNKQKVVNNLAEIMGRNIEKAIKKQGGTK